MNRLAQDSFQVADAGQVDEGEDLARHVELPVQVAAPAVHARLDLVLAAQQHTRALRTGEHVADARELVHLDPLRHVNLALDVAAPAVELVVLPGDRQVQVFLRSDVEGARVELPRREGDQLVAEQVRWHVELLDRVFADACDTFANYVITLVVDAE